MNARGLGIFLLEGVEDALQRLGGDPPSRIADGKAQAQRVGVRGTGQRHVDPHLAPVGELDRVRDQVEQDLPELAHVPPQPGQRRGGQVGHQGQALFLGHRRHQKRDVAQGFGQIEVHRLACSLALLQLRIVKDAVQQAHQALARGQSCIEPRHLVPRQPIARQVAEHPQHPVHRRADLVAHHRQELGLRAVCRFGPVPRRVMGRHLAAQGLGLLVHQFLQLAAVAAQLFQVTLAFRRKLPVCDGLLAEHLDCPLHLRNLVGSRGADRLAQAALGQVRHARRQRIQPPDQVATNIEPKHRQRQDECQHRRKGV